MIPAKDASTKMIYLEKGGFWIWGIKDFVISSKAKKIKGSPFPKDIVFTLKASVDSELCIGSTVWYHKLLDKFRLLWWFIKWIL